MTASFLPSGLFITGPHLKALKYALKSGRMQQRRDGINLPELEELAKVVAGYGQVDEPKTLASDAGAISLTGEEAAALLGVSPRTVRRIAPQLDGIKRAGAWTIPARAVLEHLGEK